MENIFAININGEFVGFVDDEVSAKIIVEKLSNGAEDVVKRIKPNRVLYQERSEKRDSIKVYSMASGNFVDGSLKCRAIVSYVDVGYISPNSPTSGTEVVPVSVPEVEEKKVEKTTVPEAVVFDVSLLDTTVSLGCTVKKSDQDELDRIFSDIEKKAEESKGFEVFDQKKLSTYGPSEPSFEKKLDTEVKIYIPPEKTEEWTESDDEGSTNSEDDIEYIAPPKSRIPFLYPQPQKILKYMGA